MKYKIMMQQTDIRVIESRDVVQPNSAGYISCRGIPENNLLLLILFLIGQNVVFLRLKI